MKNKISIIAILCMVLIIAFVMGLTACSSKPSAAVGDIIRFSGIDWRVLEVKNGSALVISDKILTQMPYQEPPDGQEFLKTTIPWEECSMRQYLNGQFYNSTFSAAEKESIVAATVKNYDNYWYGTPGGNDTKDKVFLLSIEEMLQYFGDSNAEQNTLGKISDQFNEGRIAETQGGEAAWWWLRSCGGNFNSCTIEALSTTVLANGVINIQGDYAVNKNGGVRPALWLKLNGEVEIYKNNEIKNNAAQTEDDILSDAELTYTMPEIKSDYMEIMTHILSSYESNCYFVTNKQTQDTVIIDPGDNADLLRRTIEENKLKPVAILLTHSHIDHIGAVEPLTETFEIPIYAWIDERDNFGEGFLANNITWLDNGDTPLELAGFLIKIMHTPGHTAGSACYYVESENILFSGDTMFLGTYGRTDLDTGDLDAIINSFENKLYVLPNNTIVYPGHGETTTISYEKEYNSINRLL